MFAGFYTAASGVLMQQRVLNVLTNNVANVKTPGYRSERVLSETFRHELLTRMERGNTGGIGAGDPVRVVREVPTNFATSSYHESNRPFDLALKGAGFFNIQTQPATNDQGQETAPAQILLTRNGNFDIDEEGFLCLPGVGRVLGRRGEIDLKGSSDFQVNGIGEVYDSRGRRVDTLMVTEPRAGVPTTKVENGLYSIDRLEDGVPVPDTQVYQYTLEQSNVDVNRELTLAMEAQRAFQSCSQALKIVDSMNGKAATQIASL